MRVREVDQLVSLRPVEHALGRLDYLPLHRIARRDHRELAARDGRVRGGLDVLGDERAAHAKADLRRQGTQRVGRDIIPRGAHMACHAAVRWRRRGGRSEAEECCRPGSTHCDKTTESHGFASKSPRNISPQCESFGAKLSNNGTVEVQVNRVNSSYFVKILNY